MNMHGIFSKVSNTTQGITSSIKRGAQDLYSQYQQNSQQNQNPQNANNNNMGQMMNQNGNSSNMNHNNNLPMGNEENPFLQAIVPPGTIPPGTTITVGQHQVMIERHLAEGGFAHVYVVQGQSGKKAVLKQIIVPDQEQVLTFQREINFMKSVSGNDNIVQFYDSQVRARSKSEGEGFEVLILMEYCSEGHIVDLMNSRLKVRLTESEIINIFYSVCKAVAHLHYQNPPIIHRDIKVENVLITSDGKYKLCDFGSATTEIIPPNKSLNIQEIHKLEEEIQKYTTIQYRPPEMCDLYQRRGLNEKVDTWALGVMLYKLCYYTTPFEDGNTLAIVNCSYTKPQTPVYSSHIHHLIDMMLVVEPSLRANIYDILSYVCSILNVPCPITNKYNYTDTSAKNNSNSPFFAASSTNSVLTSVKQPVVTVPIVQNPNPTPMRRGRPNQKDRKTNNTATNANAVVASKLATLSYNSQQMQQSSNDSFKTPITINEGANDHLSPTQMNGQSTTSGSNNIPAQPSGGESGSFFTKYSQDKPEQRANKDSYKANNTLPVKNNVSGSNNKNTADQNMLDSIFGKSTNNLFEEAGKNGNDNINLFDDNWIVDGSANSFDKLSEKRTNDFFSSSKDLFSNDTSNNSKKTPRPPSFTQLAQETSDSETQLSKRNSNISSKNPSLSKFKSDTFILSNTNPFTNLDSKTSSATNTSSLENPFASNESTNEDQNVPLFEAKFDDNFGDNFDDNADFDDQPVSLLGNEINEEKLNAYKVGIEKRNSITSPQNSKPPKGSGYADYNSSKTNVFSDSVFNNESHRPHHSHSHSQSHSQSHNHNQSRGHGHSHSQSHGKPINKNDNNDNTFGYAKFDDDDEDIFSPTSPSIKITSPRNVSTTITMGNTFGNESKSHEESKRNSLKDGKDKDKSDSASNHSLQNSKLNHSFQRLAMSLKKQKKHILLDDNYEEDEDDNEKDFHPTYAQMEDDDDDDNEVLINNENLSPSTSGHMKYSSDSQANNAKTYQKSISMGRFPDNYKSLNFENNRELNSSFDNRAKSPITSPSGSQPSNVVMSPRYESAKINTEDAAKPKKKTPPPIPPKPKELKKYVIPKAYPGVPQRRSSKSTDNSPVDEKNNDNSNKSSPLRVNNMATLSNLKITSIGESTTSLSSVNLNDRRHSGYYYDDEDPVQQLDEAFTNITDDMDNYQDDDDSDQDIFNSGKVKRRSKFKNTFIKH